MINAHPWWLGLLLSGALLLVIALYGWRSAPQADINRRFAAQTLVVAWWIIGIAGIHSAYYPEAWGRWTFAAAALMPAAFSAFVEVFPTRDQLFPRWFPWTIRIVAAIFATIALATPWIAHDFVVTADVWTRSSGPLMQAFVVFYLVSAAFVFALLIRKWQSARGLARAQARLYISGLFLFWAGGITTNLLLPLIIGDSRYSTLGPAFVPVFLAFVAHGIIRHRFMNIRLVIHNWLTVSVASLVSVVPFTVVVSFREMNPVQASGAGWLSSAAPLLATCLLAPPLWITTRSLLHRYVYRGNADFRLRISEASERLSQVLSPRETAMVVIDTVVAAVRPEGVAIYIADDVDREMKLLQSNLTQKSFGSPLELPSRLRDELPNRRLLASFRSLAMDTSPALSSTAAQVLDENNWALVISLITESKVIGAIAIGGKLSGAPYFFEDIALLQVLSTQATVAFKNAQLYERVLLANQHIEHIVATVQSGIVVFDDNDGVRIMNEAALRLLDLPTDWTVPVKAYVSNLPAILTSTANETRQSGSAVRMVDLVLAHRDGAIPVMCSTALLRKPNGEIVGVVLALSDLSVVRALEVERARTERLNYFETLAAALAHEIANPIAPIKLMTQLLPARSKDQAFVDEFTRTVSHELLRVEKLVERLRALSGPAHREREPVDLRTPIGHSVEIVRPLLDERAIELIFHPLEVPLVADGDASELQELFLNLLTNAAEATPERGRIVLQVRHESSEAIISISDSGPGISREIADRIFEPFVSSKHRGSGLGLTICSGVVARHKGTLTAQNTDSGATFTVRLPLAADSDVLTDAR
jgi:signal transduction histidine kinase